MPVTFFVDPEMVDDRDAKFTKVITLSYTFYETELPEETAKVDSETASTITVN
jgi:cytochrome c oxidase assembly protein subunit 11